MSGTTRQRVVIDGDLDRHTLEVILLEIRRRGHPRGFLVTGVHVETLAGGRQRRRARSSASSSSA